MKQFFFFSPGGCETCHFLLSSQQVHCNDLLFWALSMQAQYCAVICPCLLWLPLLWGNVRLNSSRHGQEQPILFSSSLTINPLYISLTVARSTLRPYPISPLTVTPPSVCYFLGSRAWARTRSRSYASAACWWCQCMSSCTGVGAGSTRRGRRLPCCKLSTWRQFPSGGW